MCKLDYLIELNWTYLSTDIIMIIHLHYFFSFFFVLPTTCHLHLPILAINSVHGLFLLKRIWKYMSTLLKKKYLKNISVCVPSTHSKIKMKMKNNEMKKNASFITRFFGQLILFIVFCFVFLGDQMILYFFASFVGVLWYFLSLSSSYKLSKNMNDIDQHQ